MPRRSVRILRSSLPASASSAARLACVLMLGFAAAPVAAGTVYQWKDARGVTHYSDEPPPEGATYTNRQVKDAAPAAAPATGTATTPAPAENPSCITARRNLEHLRSDKPVGHDADGDGKPDREMGPEERANQQALAEQAIKTYCIPPPAGA